MIFCLDNNESDKEKCMLKKDGVVWFFLKKYWCSLSISPEYHRLKLGEVNMAYMSSGVYPMAYMEPTMAPIEVPAM